MKEKIKSLLPHAISILVLLIVITAYFFPQLQGKVIEQGDIIQSKAKSRAVVEYEERSGDRYLWNPGQFGGMAYLYAIPATKNLLIHGRNLVRFGIPRPIGMFFSMALFSYLLFVFMGAGRWVSVGLALVTALSTNNIILWKTGHVSKIEVLQYAPLIFLGLFLLFEKRKYLLGFGIFSFGLGLNLFARHPQMTYYLFMALVCYGIYQIYQVVQSKDWRHFTKATLFVVLGVVLSLGTSASRLWSLQEHRESSMRGGQILQVDDAANDGKVSKGLDWDYAMQWSNGWKDAVASFIPGFVGGGSAHEVSKSSESFKKFRIERAPLYWGTLPFTEAPIYLGAALLFLFLFSFFLVKSKHKWWIAAAVVLTFMLSGGSNFSILNRPLFDYLPLFSSWRAPSSVLAVTVFILPIMIALGIKELMAASRNKAGLIEDARIKRALYLSAGICIGVSLLAAFIGPAVFSFESAGDARYIRQNLDISAFISDRKSLLRSDALRSLFFVGISTLLIWLYLKGKMNAQVLGFGVVAILLLDALGINLRYLGPDDYKSPTAIERKFELTDIDRQIKQQEPDRSTYRVLDVPNFNSSLGSYYHNTIGGYDPVKMRRYQDLLDRHIEKNNIKVLNMLNTKYIISANAEGERQISQNPGALGPVWFVQNIVEVSTPNEEIDALDTFDPSKDAVILVNEFKDYLSGLNIQYDSTATISMTSYTPDRIEYESNATGAQLAVFSETWFGPDKGWKVTIDGEASDFVRANYDLRAMRIPEGSHKIVFEFRPKSFYVGEIISLVSSAFVLLVLIGALYYNRSLIFNNIEQKAKPKKKVKKKGKNAKKA